MNPQSLLCYCLYCPGMQVFGLDVINDGIIINHHHPGCDWCDKWKSWRSRSQPKDLPGTEIKDELCISHAHVGRTALTCWWTTSICIWVANESERHHRISFGMNDELARWAFDGNLSKMVAADLRCAATTPAPVFGDAPPAASQHVWRYTAEVCLQHGGPTELWEKRTPRREAEDV